MVTDVSKIVDYPEIFDPERGGTWFLLNVDKYLSVSRRVTVIISVTLTMQPLRFFRNARVYLPHLIYHRTWLRTDSFPSVFPTKLLCASNIFQKFALLRDLQLNSVSTSRLSIHATFSVGCNNL